MLREQAQVDSQGVVWIMSDIEIVASQVKMTLAEIAKQANVLGVGLQNAAPGDKLGAPNNSVQYLLDVSTKLNKKSEECAKI